MNILNLDTLKILECKENEHDYLVAAELVSPPYVCPLCGVARPQTKRFGKKNQLYMDTPIHAKRVGIMINRQRYRCVECDGTFWELLPMIDDSHKATKRLVEFICKQSLRRTFTSIADDVGVTEGTIRNIFHIHVNELEKDRITVTPQWLGIDEIHIIKKPRCVITNIQENTLVDLLPNRNKETVLQYLFNLPFKEEIEFVTMDMWAPYRDAVRVQLPQATVIVDKFHIVKMANECLNTVRKSIRNELSIKARRSLMHDRFILLKRRHGLTMKDQLTLESWTLNYPLLGLSYQLKEDFFDIWNNDDRQEAERCYQQWLNQLTPEAKDAFKPLVTAMKNWHNEIFTYFEIPLTNAYTESFNNLIRITNRIGRGYSFEVLRAKMLFTNGGKKVSLPKYDADVFCGLYVPDEEIFKDVFLNKYATFGIDISTLAAILEQD